MGEEKPIILRRFYLPFIIDEIFSKKRASLLNRPLFIPKTLLGENLFYGDTFWQNKSVPDCSWNLKERTDMLNTKKNLILLFVTNDLELLYTTWPDQM